MKITGSTEYLSSYDLPVKAYSNIYTNEGVLWVTSPMYQKIGKEYVLLVMILAHPKDMKEAIEIEKKHGELYNSPLMKALREV